MSGLSIAKKYRPISRCGMRVSSHSCGVGVCRLINRHRDAQQQQQQQRRRRRAPNIIYVQSATSQELSRNVFKDAYRLVVKKRLAVAVSSGTN